MTFFFTDSKGNWRWGDLDKRSSPWAGPFGNFNTLLTAWQQRRKR